MGLIEENESPSEFKSNPPVLGSAESLHFKSSDLPFSPPSCEISLRRFRNLSMEESASAAISSSPLISSDVCPQGSMKKLSENLDDRFNTQLLPTQLEIYSKLQDDVTILRVQMQQLRTAASRARKELAKQESKIEQALRQSTRTRKQMELNDYEVLLSSAETARDSLGPAEDAVEASEFRLVHEEARLAREGRKLRRLLLEHGNSQLARPGLNSLTLLPTSPTPLIESASRPASTVIYFQSDSGSQEQAYFDPDYADSPAEDFHIQLKSDAVEQFAPDLNPQNTSLLPYVPRRPQTPELYVKDQCELEESSANDVEYMEPVVNQLPKSLPLPHRLLEIFFREIDLTLQTLAPPFKMICASLFKRWPILMI